MKIFFYERLETRKMTRQQKTLIGTSAREQLWKYSIIFLCVRQNLLDFIMHEESCVLLFNDINQFATKEI